MRTGLSSVAERKDPTGTRRRLTAVRVVALTDLALLLALLVASFSGARDAVAVLGPTHGLVFIALMYQWVRGAGEGRWSWWLPLIVLVTTGPPGSLFGEWRVRRALDAANA